AQEEGRFARQRHERQGRAARRRPRVRARDQGGGVDMAVEHAIQDLPLELTLDDAVEAVYGDDLRWAEEKLRQRLSVLIECDKQVVPYLYTALRSRLREEREGRALRCRFVSGRPARREQSQEEGQPGGGEPREEMQQSLIGRMVRELGELVRSAEPGTVVVV